MASNEVQLVEKQIVLEAVKKIVAHEAPEEFDIAETIVNEFYGIDLRNAQTGSRKGQMFSFVGPEMQQYLATAITFVLTHIVVAYLQGVLKKAIEKTADKSVDVLAKQIQNTISKLRGNKDKGDAAPKIDILVPVNWQEMQSYIESESKRTGMSGKQAAQVSNAVIKELKEDQVLFGELCLTVTRIPVEQGKDKKK